MPDPISSTFSALADPTRRAILARLALGETNVTELAAPFEMSLPAVSKHLRVLERAGLIARSREAQWRPCTLKPGPLKQAAGWLEEYRQFWGAEFLTGWTITCSGYRRSKKRANGRNLDMEQRRREMRAVADNFMPEAAKGFELKITRDV